MRPTTDIWARATKPGILCSCGVRTRYLWAAGQDIYVCPVCDKPEPPVGAGLAT